MEAVNLVDDGMEVTNLGDDETGDLNCGVLCPADLDMFETNFKSERKNCLAMNMCADRDPIESCVQHYRADIASHVFTHKIDTEAKPVTNQKNSGRCWIFAALNILRIPFMKVNQLEEFEFSQSFVFFYDKVERCNYFLHTVRRLLQKKEPVSGRLISFLLQDPIADGGQWDMVVNIIEKYGVVPKLLFPESFCCGASSKLNTLLKSKVREYVHEMKVMIDSNRQVSNEMINGFMKELYRIIAICIGIPPAVFSWEYYDKEKVYHTIENITPKEFYEKYVKPYCYIDKKVCLVNDPRPDNAYGFTYTVDCLGNMVGGRRTIYVNEPIECLMEAAVDSLQNNVPVWFGCEINKSFDGKTGMQDVKIHDYKLMFGMEIHTSLSKADRLIYGDSMMNHAMVLTGVSLDAHGKPTKWRVENSWGEDRGNKGYLVMTTEWFKEFVFEVVVDRAFVSYTYNLQTILQQEPKILPAWDPMGSLAKYNY